MKNLYHIVTRFTRNEDWSIRWLDNLDFKFFKNNQNLFFSICLLIENKVYLNPDSIGIFFINYPNEEPTKPNFISCNAFFFPNKS